MAALARLEASSCSNPKLDLYTKVSGVLTDVAVLEFQIWENVSNPGTPVQVFPTTPGNRQSVNLLALCPTGEKLGTGHYVAAYTPPITELIGTHEIRWFFKLTLAAPEQTYVEEFEVLAQASASSSNGYTTIQNLRDEGVTPSMASDSRLEVLIERASRYVDFWTGRFFTPRSAIYKLDGRNSRGLLLEEPIISISEVLILDANEIDSSFTEVDLDDLRIYNRHLTQNLLDPDDRDNPRIEFMFPRRLNFDGLFPLGRQNIQVTGVFGYTEPDGTAQGRTPFLIEHATNLLVIREIPLLTDDDRFLISNSRRITQEKTRDQSVSYGEAATGGGPYSGAGAGRMTGDPQIDVILERYARPTKMGAA
jgi:hypothetical protein